MEWEVYMGYPAFIWKATDVYEAKKVLAGKKGSEHI